MRYTIAVITFLFLLVSCNGEKQKKVHYSEQVFEEIALDRIIAQYPTESERDSLYALLYQKYDTDSASLDSLREEFFRYSDDLRARLKKVIVIIDSLKTLPPDKRF